MQVRAIDRLVKGEKIKSKNRVIKGKRNMEREREREIYGREETIVSDSEGVRKEKENGREKE